MSKYTPAQYAESARKHGITPGPWRSEGNDNHPFYCNPMNNDSPYGTVFGARVMVADGGIVCLTQFCCEDEYEAEDEANRSCIASLPDLLIALDEKDAEIERLTKALNSIAYGPFGRAEAADREVLDAMTEFARAALQGGGA